MKAQRVACRPRARVGALLATLICVCAWLGAPASTAARVTGADAQLRAAVAVERARPRAPRLSRELFLAQPVLRSAALSPDGRQVATLLVHGDQRAVWLQASAGGPPRRLLAHGQAERLHWTRDGRWLLLASPRQVFALAMAGQPGSGIVTVLGGRSRRELLMVDPSQPAAIIVIEHPPRVSRAPRHWRAYRMHIGGRQALVREDATQFIELAFDAQGRLAWLLRVAVDKHLLMRVDAAGGARELARCTGTQRCQLLGTTAGGDVLLQASLGGDLERLLRIDSRGAIQALHGDPRGEADLDEVVLDPVGGAPLIAHYRSTVAASHGLTPEARRHVAAIERSLPHRNLRIDVGRGPGAHWLVHERAPTLRGERLHLYAPATGRLVEIVADAGLQHQGRRLSRPPASAMARKLALTWRASDGMRLHGFVLVPPGIDPTRAPLITRVHGGPFNHDGPVFDADAQFLANRGYLVFEPNFRGSTGHGMAYKTAPRGDFGNGRVQRDIVEGTRHLLALGIGDPSRVGIMGASFGGYSTLLGLSFQPELFKVGIAAVPPADLGWVLRDYARGDTQWAGIPLATQLKLLALDPADPVLARRLAAQSPNANAGRMRRPLLLLAGGEDERVPIRGVTHYAARLKTLGRDVSLFVDADAGHGVDDARTREAYFYLMESLLHRQLGGPAPAPPGRALGEHLQRNLRLRGPGLGPPAP